MAVFKKMFKKFLGFEEESVDENLYEEFAEEENVFQEETYIKPNIEMKQKQEITLYPKTFGDACEVVEQIELGNIITINMNDVDIDTCKRITDFVLGAIYVLEGDVEKISKKVFRFWTNK
ncbi:cell division protein SepF [Mycoplasmatota bacterium]|nr:cell division protein SepF [Mycoplasmatota bacterium]